MLSMSIEDGKIDDEVTGVGAGLGGEFFNTSELRPMKYKEAMKVDREGLQKRCMRSTKEWLQMLCGAR